MLVAVAHCPECEAEISGPAVDHFLPSHVRHPKGGWVLSGTQGTYLFECGECGHRGEYAKDVVALKEVVT